MAEIFFSYSSSDRSKVQLVRDALEAEGLTVFWDQTTPAGVDWDTWIRQNLSAAKCALVFWSANSIASPNVRHEATVARDRGKLIPVMLEALSTDMFPMGLYNVQAADLTSWTSDVTSPQWIKLRAEVEAKLTPLWVQRRLHEIEAELTAERARRQAIESRDSSLQARIAKDAETEIQYQRELRLARDTATKANDLANREARQRSLLEQEIAELKDRLAASNAASGLRAKPPRKFLRPTAVGMMPQAPHVSETETTAGETSHSKLLDGLRLPLLGIATAALALLFVTSQKEGLEISSRRTLGFFIGGLGLASGLWGVAVIHGKPPASKFIAVALFALFLVVAALGGLLLAATIMG